jgi:hypothetical protein
VACWEPDESCWEPDESCWKPTMAVVMVVAMVAAMAVVMVAAMVAAMAVVMVVARVGATAAALVAVMVVATAEATALVVKALVAAMVVATAEAVAGLAFIVWLLQHRRHAAYRLVRGCFRQIQKSSHHHTITPGFQKCLHTGGGHTPTPRTPPCWPQGAC